jgi:DNA repair protein RadC
MEATVNAQDWTKVAEIEIVYRTKVKPSERPRIETSADSYKLLQALWNQDLIGLQEQMKIVLLNRRNRVLGIHTLSSGGISGTVADPKLILAVVIKSGACSVILSHNHPSGEVRPSKEDLQLTYKIREALKFLDVRLMDHVIISSEDYYSFADEGLM